MTGASGKGMSVFEFDFNECAKDWQRNVCFRGTSSRNPQRAVTRDDFYNCFTRKRNVHQIETIYGINSENESNQQGEITGNNAEEHTESLADYRVDQLISGLSVDAPVSNDDGKQMSSTTPDHSGDLETDLNSEDEGLSERRFPTSNAISDASDEEGLSEQSYSDTSHNSEDYDNMESQDTDILVVPEFGLFGDFTFLVPRLIFSAEGIKLEIVNQRSSCDEVHAFQWSLMDVEYLKTYWLPGVNVAVAILDLKQGCNNELETFFRATGASVLFAFNDASWLEQFQHIISLNDAYNTIWKSLDGSVCQDEDTLCELLPRKLSFAFEDRNFGRFEETFGEFVFPKGDPDAVTICGRDIVLLQPETFINDTLIDFYIKYLQSTISDKKREACHFFNSFFFRKLADLDKAPDTEVVNRQAFQRVRKWTRRVNLFEKDYIFIPVNYSLHWSLIVICNPGEILEDGNHSKTPCILHMDSLGSHTNLRKLIQSYLWEEWRERHMEDEAMFNTTCERFSNMTFISVEVPQQDNCFDCGLFLLHYVEMFLRDAPAKFNLVELKNTISKFLNRDWFLPAEASLLKRFHIRKLIHQLYKEFSGIGPTPTYGPSHQSHEARQSDTGTSQEVECILEDSAPNQECSESLLLLDKVKDNSMYHTDEDTQISLSQAGKRVAMKVVGRELGVVCAEYGGSERENHICDDEQIRLLHHGILSQQLKSTLSHALEDDDQSTQDLPSGSGTNQFSDVLYDFATNDHGKSEKETGYLCDPPGISLGVQFGLLTNQHNPITDQLVDQKEVHPEKSSKRVIFKEGSKSPTASESSFHVRMQSNCDTRPHKKPKAMDDIVYEGENKMSSEENEKYATAVPSEENEKSATVMPLEEIEKSAVVMDLRNADEMSFSLETRLDMCKLSHETKTSHPDEIQIEGRNMVGKDHEDNASPNHAMLSLQQEKTGDVKSVSFDNDNNDALWKRKLKSSFAENLNSQDLASVSHCDTVDEVLEDLEKDMKNPFVSCQANQQSLDCYYDAGCASIDKSKYSLSVEDRVSCACNTPVNSVMVADDKKCDDSISKETENSNKCDDSSGMTTENVDKIVIVEDVFESKEENEDVNIVVADGKCTNSVSNTNGNIDKYVGTEGRVGSLPEFRESTCMTPQNKQPFSLEGAAECLSSNDFASPPQESLISRTRSRKTPSTVGSGGNLNGVKETPRVERPRTRSVTKNLDSSKFTRENRRRTLNIFNK